jgi:hypothetical protein
MHIVCACMLVHTQSFVGDSHHDQCYFYRKMYTNATNSSTVIAVDYILYL